MNRTQTDRQLVGASSSVKSGFLPGLHVTSKGVRVQTQGDGDVLDITKQIQNVICNTGLSNGIATVFVQGSTAGITTLEFEPGLVSDLKSLFERVAPKENDYQHTERHNEGNGFSQIRASLLGPSLTIPFSDGFLTLGSWQQVVLVDFDKNPRQREIVVQVMGV
jgi:secondary thiamine-phosphate synthase enzyme